MSLFDYKSNKDPEYYDAMYMDGYTPEQILQIAHQTMICEHEERKAAQRAEENEIPNAKIISEVKIR